jgi:hypothetical protein
VEPSSRIAKARRRVRAARYVIGAVAVAGFAVFGIAARDAHPATHHTVQVSDDNQSDDSFSFGTPSVGSSSDYGSAPEVQSGGS